MGKAALLELRATVDDVAKLMKAAMSLQLGSSLGAARVVCFAQKPFPKNSARAPSVLRETI